MSGFLTNILPIVCALLLTILQLAFGFMMHRHKKAFLRYHQALSVVIFLIVLGNILFFPVVFFIGIITLIALATQIVIGIILIENEKVKKYHKPLGFFILALILANLVFVLV